MRKAVSNLASELKVAVLILRQQSESRCGLYARCEGTKWCIESVEQLRRCIARPKVLTEQAT